MDKDYIYAVFLVQKDPDDCEFQSLKWFFNKEEAEKYLTFLNKLVEDFLKENPSDTKENREKLDTILNKENVNANLYWYGTDSINFEIEKIKRG